jgi:DNA repair exonuclease SbcCD ATPase subunit/DNA repair exonuclease SbcCD nuclease subunit
MIINVPFKKLRHVVHVADIHVRLFRRHEEYEEAFDRLYKDIRSKNLEDFVIVLAGDIVHAKTDMSPEMVEVASKFLKNMADIAPTILIAGNHDCNLANQNRLDALSPIVNNLQHPNLHYVKYSSVVRVADTDFAVCSIFDEQITWPTANDCSAPNTVALYHGPVHGSLTDANFTITNRHVGVDTFDGYHMVMLGDIHRHQVLQEYNPLSNKPVVVYASSLLQQNHGETIDNHGWCLWNIEDRTFEFVPLHNDYGYATIEVIGDRIEMPQTIPNKARVRLFTGDLDNTESKKLISSLRKKYNIIELSVNKNRFNKQNIVGSSNTSHELLDFTSPSTQNQFIVDWLTRNYPGLDDGIIQNIQNINIELNGKIHHEDHSRNINWRPLNFKFSNMFSYGEGNEINFDDMNGLYGIFAQNASGKSSILDSLMFCLYDKTPRAFKGDHIMNNRKNTFECELTFEINDEVFGIKRIGNRKKNGDVKVDVEFWREAGNSRISLNGESRRDTNANIRTYVGTYEDFIMTAFSGQTSNSLFIDKSHSERKDLLIQFMGLNIFDKLYDIANEEAKGITGVLKRFKKSDVTDELLETANKLETQNELLNDIETQYEDIKSIKSSYEKNIEELLSNKRIVPPSAQDIDVLTRNLEIANQKLVGETNNLDAITTELQIKSESLQSIQSEYETYDTYELLVAKQTYTALMQEVEVINNKVKVANTKLAEKVKFKQKLEGYNYNPDCPVCVENNKSVIDDLESVNTEIDELTNSIAKYNDDKMVAQKEMETLGDKVSDYNKANEIKEYLDNLKNIVIPKLSNEVESSRLKINDIKSNIGNIEDAIEVYHQNKEAILHNQEIDGQIKDIQSNITDTDRKMNELQKSIRELHGNVSVLSAKQTDLQAKLKEAEDLESSFEAYTHYMSAIGRDGVPYEIITKAIPNIESEINTILSDIVDFNVSLEVDGKNINGKLNYDYDRIWPLENSSGMERFVSSLAIRVALMNVSNLPKPNFLIIDEGFGTLDNEHLNSMQSLFNSLKTHFDFILIISHLDNARDMVDNLIEIKKEDNYSYISL